MKTNLLKLACAFALLGMAATASAETTLSIFGTGTGTLNGVGFTDNTFDWTLTFDSDNPWSNWGATSPVYTVLTSQLSLQGGPLINVTTQPAGMWINFSSPDSFAMAPMNGIPGPNILTIFGTPGWDGVSAFTSDADPNSGFNQFYGIATDQGVLSMPSGTVSLVTITGAPVPEPSTLALAGLGGLGLLLFRRRK